jgi:misacylated tRNA(Ala) deacylase
MPTEPLFRDDAYLRESTAIVTAVREGAIECDRTVFYPTGGGQAGDTGLLRRADGEDIAISNTRKGDARRGEAADAIVHEIAWGAPLPHVGEAVSLVLDWDRRYAMMRLHTCLHVLSCVVVAPVTGGNIAPDKGRLDFDVDMNLLDAERITREVNELIARAVPTETVWISDAELDARPDLVKTMSVQPPRGAGRVRLLRIEGIDLQPCGGTHVRNIGEIGPVRVTRIRNEGRRNKRVEIAFA